MAARIPYKSITFHITPLHARFPAADLIHRTPKDIKQIYSLHFPVHMVAIALKRFVSTVIVLWDVIKILSPNLFINYINKL